MSVRLRIDFELFLAVRGRRIHIRRSRELVFNPTVIAEQRAHEFLCFPHCQCAFGSWQALSKSVLRRMSSEADQEKRNWFMDSFFGSLDRASIA